MMTKPTLAGLVAALLTATSAQAVTITTSSPVSGVYDVTPATSAGGTPHSLWFQKILSAGLSTVYSLTSPGTMTADAAGAVITGSMANLNDPTAGFDLEFTYDRDFLKAPAFKDVFGGNGKPDVAVEHGNEDYLDLESGTITGTGFFDGLVFTVTRAPADGTYATQIGGGVLAQTGANQHNSNYGLSGWFFIETVDSINCANCTDQAFFQGLVGSQGDVNFDLSPAAVPLPAAGGLLLGALALGAGVRARKRKA